MPAEGRGKLIIQPLAGYEPDVGRALWPLEDARRRTAHTLAGMDPKLVDWAPPGGPGADMNSLGSLLYHVAAIEASWLYEEALGRPWPPAVEALFPYPVREEQGRLTVVRGESLDEHWARLVEVRRRLLAAYQTMTLEDFRRVRALPEYDVSPEWVLHHLAQHEAEHRGHIAALRARHDAP
jgi:uncharacterized damage-inducible protein DinB